MGQAQPPDSELPPLGLRRLPSPPQALPPRHASAYAAFFRPDRLFSAVGPLTAGQACGGEELGVFAGSQTQTCTHPMLTARFITKAAALPPGIMNKSTKISPSQGQSRGFVPVAIFCAAFASSAAKMGKTPIFRGPRPLTLSKICAASPRIIGPLQSVHKVLSFSQ